MAARQKSREIEMCNEEWERRKVDTKHQMMDVSKKRAEEVREIEVVQEQKEKLSELLTQASENI